MKKIHFDIFCVLLISLLGSACSSTGGGRGNGVSGDQLDFTPLPGRQEGISLYGPGSENVQRDPVPPIYFDFDSSHIRPGELPKVEQLAEIAGNTLVIIAGHTDQSGTLEYNRALGERRAMAVRRELLNIGVPVQNIQTISYGEEMITGQGDAMDRRAEFGALRN